MFGSIGWRFAAASTRIDTGAFCACAAAAKRIANTSLRIKTKTLRPEYAVALAERLGSECARNVMRGRKRERDPAHVFGAHSKRSSMNRVPSIGLNRYGAISTKPSER